MIKWTCQSVFYYSVSHSKLVCATKVTALKPEAVSMLLILCIVAGLSALEFLGGGCYLFLLLLVSLH